MSSAAVRSREAVSRSLADQWAPVLRLHADVRGWSAVRLNVESARSRLARSRPAFDAHTVVRAAGDLAPWFGRAISAYERAGMASTDDVLTIRRHQHDVTELALAWTDGARAPADPAQRVARNAAGLLATAVLSATAAQVEEAGILAAWPLATCPCCGGVPDLALTHGADRMVVCSRCDTRWLTHGMGCLTCGASAEPTLVRVRSAYLGYSLVICHACGHYLKERGGHGACDPLLERFLTAQLDEAAQRRGLRGCN
jgi:formate dehydrogenase maturation protein FdhE